MNLTNASGYDNTISFYINIGEVDVTDPLGPDAYGYYCYDDDDINYADKPTYSWSEIDPSYGGSGMVLSLSDAGNTGDLQTISLPFNLKFYGENYSQITVCSNGWVAPGITEQYSFMNWQIPGSGGPSPMIAPFWDDLKIGSGSVCYEYDASNNLFIVEWSHLQNEYDNSEETFQLIIYDANHYSSETGDSNLKFQYKTINNTDIGDYTSYHVQHGEYATVGIEDQTALVGLEYTYDNDYPDAAKTLQNEMAIMFTTNSPNPHTEAFLVINDVVIDDPTGNNDGEINPGETINLDIILKNMGLTEATNISAVLSTSDSYTTISQSSSNYNNIGSGLTATNLTDYVFSVSSSCPDAHQISFSLAIHCSGREDWTREFQLQVQAPDVEYQSLTIIDGDNGILDPNETADLHVYLVNNGGEDVPNLNVHLSTTDSYVTINDNSDVLSLLTSGGSDYVVFNVTVSGAAPIGHAVLFNLDFNSSALGYSANDTFSASIGLQVEDFETGDFSKYGWTFDGDADWIIDAITPYEGSYCAQSGDISDSQTSSLILEAYVTTDDSISFYRKVSSEHNYDYLKFYIDDVLQERWSGEVSWAKVVYPVSSGERTFKWEFYKDGSVSNGSDCAWIDYIIFPPLGTPPSISVSPTSYSKTVNVGGSATDDLYIGNNGGSTLNYRARVAYTARISDNSQIFDREKIRELYKVGDRKICEPIHAPAIKKASETALRDCEFTIDLYDDYGDGWNGGSVDVLVNGTVVLNDLTLDDGHGPETHSFQIITGDQISTTYTGGSWTYENSYYIYDNDGTEVASDGIDGSTPTGIDPFVATCTNDVQLAWLTLDGENEISGTVAVGASDDVISVLFDTVPDNLGIGTYNANIIITGNDPDNEEVIIPVTMEITDHLDAPTNVNISISGTNLTISWNAVSGADSYKIVSDSDPYGAFSTIEASGITATNWTTSIPTNKTFYRVIAVSGTRIIGNKNTGVPRRNNSIGSCRTC